MTSKEPHKRLEKASFLCQKSSLSCCYSERQQRNKAKHFRKIEIEDIKDLDYAIAELEEMFKVHQEQLKDKFEDKRYSLAKKQESLKTHLRGLFEQVPQSETKTQRKVKLLNADVVVKKPKPDFEKNTDKLLEWALANQREDLIARKEIVSFKWGDFKKDLVDTDYGIVEFTTGETLKIEGLVAIMKSEELEIKY